jgi:selenocysteine-specific elongation factor
VIVDGGLVRPADAVDPYGDHPFLTALSNGGFAPPSPDEWNDPATGRGVDRADLRELVRRGHAVQRDGLVFHVEAIDGAALVAAHLLAEHPEGFTVAQFRDATGASRKFALPLVSELDARGVTRRRDDLRIGGPRLPDLN